MSKEDMFYSARSYAAEAAAKSVEVSRLLDLLSDWPEPGASSAPEPVPDPLPLPAELGHHIRTQLLGSFNDVISTAIGFLDADNHCYLGALVQMRGQFREAIPVAPLGEWLEGIMAMRQSGLVKYQGSSRTYYSFDPRRADLRFIRWEIPERKDLSERLVADAYRAAARAVELMREHN